MFDSAGGDADSIGADVWLDGVPWEENEGMLELTFRLPYGFGKDHEQRGVKLKVLGRCDWSHRTVLGLH